MPRAELVKGGVKIFCPGCKKYHVLDARWAFNGDLEKPTFSPSGPGKTCSLLIRTGHYSQFHKQGDGCWCTFKERYGYDPGFVCKQCHSHITDGRIAFLADCSHALRGQTVDLPDIATGVALEI